MKSGGAELEPRTLSPTVNTWHGLAGLLAAARPQRRRQTATVVVARGGSLVPRPASPTATGLRCGARAHLRHATLDRGDHDLDHSRRSVARGKLALCRWRRLQRAASHNTLLRANPPKGGDAEPRGYGGLPLRSPGRQRLDAGRRWRPVCLYPRGGWS